MKRLFWLSLLLVSPALVLAQGGVPADPVKVIDSQGRPRGGAVVTICSSAGTGIPCTPLASVFTDAGLTNPAANPMTTDGLGNLPVIYATPGVYKFTVTGVGITTTGQPFTATVAGTGGGNVLSGSPNTFTAANTFTQQVTSTLATGTAPFSIASTTVVPNLNAQLHGGLTAPASAIVGISDTQTLTNKTLGSPTINTPTITSPATTNLNDTGTQLSAKRFAAASTASNPTCSVTGAGTGASCAMLSVSSSDSAGAMLISTGTTPSPSGTATLTFNSNWTNSAFCTFTLTNQASSWNARATVIETSAGNIASQTLNWDNNAVSLTASQANSVGIAFVCIGHN